MNKKIIIVIVLSIIIGLVIFTGIKTYKSPTQRKLMGFWNIEVENTNWVRNNDYHLLNYNLHFTKDTINVPLIYDTVGDIDFQGKTFLELDDNFFTDEIREKGRKHFEEMQRKAKGSWKVISTDPDSVFFNVPENPLHGKYAIRFFDMGHNFYKIELKNDSTYLICSRQVIFVKR